VKQRILGVVKQRLLELPVRSVAVFKREGYDTGFFSELVKAQQPFVTWEKNINSARLKIIPGERFTTAFQFKGKCYNLLEKEKAFFYIPQGGASRRLTLRRIIIWNHPSNRRIAVFAYAATTIALKHRGGRPSHSASLGASENTFKHLQSRHPLHYHPGFKLVDNEHQAISDPQIKDKSYLIKRLRNGIDRLLRKPANTHCRGSISATAVGCNPSSADIGSVWCLSGVSAAWMPPSSLHGGIYGVP
jgi:hypothetical protein